MASTSPTSPVAVADADAESAKKVVGTNVIAVDPSEFPHLLKQFYDRCARPAPRDPTPQPPPSSTTAHLIPYLAG